MRPPADCIRCGSSKIWTNYHWPDPGDDEYHCTCLDCEAPVPLGPSGEADPVEVRAAELAACLFDAKERIRSNRRDKCGCFDRGRSLSAADELRERWLSDLIHDREPRWE